MTASPAIRAQFRGTIGKFALDAGFTAPAKGVTALFGPSGCGKTTVLRCIAGLLRINGVCEIDGEVWQDENGAFLPTYKRPLGYVFQEASLFSISPCAATSCSARRATIATEPKAGSSSTKWSSSRDHAAARPQPAQSIGRRAPAGRDRARALSQPKLLLMDEPLSALDRATKNEILPFLERLRDHLDLPVVYITHDIAEVERLADQMVLMDKGRVIGAGPLEDLQSDPSLPLAAARDAAVSFEGVVQASEEAYGLVTLKVRGGVLTAPAPRAGRRAAAHPRHRQRREPTREAPGPSSILNVLPARIVSMKPVDTNEVVVVVALGEDGSGARLLSRMMRKSWEELGLAEGVNVYAQVKAVALAPGRGELG